MQTYRYKKNIKDFNLGGKIDFRHSVTIAAFKDFVQRVKEKVVRGEVCNPVIMDTAASMTRGTVVLFNNGSHLFKDASYDEETGDLELTLVPDGPMATELEKLDAADFDLSGRFLKRQSHNGIQIFRVITFDLAVARNVTEKQTHHE